VLGDAQVPFRVAALRSSDNGATWSAPVPVGSYVLGDEPFVVAARVGVERRGGGGFDLVTLPSPFDLRRTFAAGLPYDGGMSVGVTQHLHGLDRRFAAAHTVGPPVSAAPTEVRLTTVVEKRVRKRRR